MSTRSRASILRLHLAPRTRMNIIPGRPMAAVSPGGVRTIRSTPHGGIGWQKVSLYPCLSEKREICLTGNTSNGSRFESGHCKTSCSSWRETDPGWLNSRLLQTFNTLQGKSSVRTKPCTGDCIPAKICYMRSGSVPIALQNCKPGFGSVQSW